MMFGLRPKHNHSRQTPCGETCPVVGQAFIDLSKDDQIVMLALANDKIGLLVEELAKLVNRQAEIMETFEARISDLESDRTYEEPLI